MKNHTGTKKANSPYIQDPHLKEIDIADNGIYYAKLVEAQFEGNIQESNLLIGIIDLPRYRICG